MGIWAKLEEAGLDINGNKMKWTAFREDEDGKTFTAEFEMTKVKE